MWFQRGLLLGIGWLVGASVAAAGTLETDGISLPLQCELGKTCWVANYVDVDKTGGVKDFRCRGRSYNRHDGVDFAIRDLGVMAEGVPVLASASGIVRNVRDGMEDIAIADETSRSDIKDRECGNGVLVGHDEAWETQYCHLRKGSVQVKQGERVRRGQQIGLVGLSGKTQFPHVHLTVRRHGQVIDPFTGRPMEAGCGLAGKALWRESVSYEDVALYNVGIAGELPDVAAIRSGKRGGDSLAATSPLLVLWIDIFGVEAGDRLRFRITGPNGQPVLEQEGQIEKTQARRFVYVGKSQGKVLWPTGTYTGQVTLTRMRDGQLISSEAVSTVAVR